MNTVATLGHNLASPRDLTRDVLADLGRWLADTPVIEDEDKAREAARLAKRTQNIIRDIDAERKTRVGPLNDEVSRINDEYKTALLPLKAIADELRKRMTAWAEAEEARRVELMIAARIAAEEAAARADEAIRAEQEAVEDAADGVLDIDLVSTVVESQTAVAEAKRAERVALRAERDISVRMAPGLGARAMSLRTKEELTVSDPVAAIGALGLTDSIIAGILTSARAYRKLKGKLPPGIIANSHRSV